MIFYHFFKFLLCIIDVVAIQDENNKKNDTFWYQITFLKSFPMLFWYPNPSYAKNWVEFVSKQAPLIDVD